MWVAWTSTTLARERHADSAAVLQEGANAYTVG